MHWTAQQYPAMCSVDKRASSFSWLELACLVSVVTGMAVGPNNATFQQACAVVKQLWNMLVGFFEVADGAGNSLALKKAIKVSHTAGASVTCGIPSPQGLNRRVLLEDIPGSSISVATLIKFAAKSQCKLTTCVGDQQSARKFHSRAHVFSDV